MIEPEKSWSNKETHYLKAMNSEWYKALVTVQNELSCATYDFYRSQNMKTMFLPVTTNSISSPMGLGSDSKPVQIDFFNQKTYLADSMQFMLEYGCRYFKEGCYYLMPSFRGEQADERHLCQFYHSEAEIPGKLENVIQLVENYIRTLCSVFLRDCRPLIENVAGSISHVETILKKQRFPRITYDDAVRELRGVEGALEYDCENNLTFITGIGEKHLLSLYHGVVWLTYMDAAIVPFYQASDDGIHANCADLLMGIGETVGCGERHENGVQVLEALKKHRVDSAPYDWYITMKNIAPMKTSGFGMGTERFILWLLQKDDIRDCQLLPRFNGEIFIP